MIMTKLLSVGNGVTYGGKKEKAVKVIMDKDEKEKFLNGAGKLVFDVDADFRDYLINGWRKCEPYDEDERKFFEDREIYSIMFYSKHMSTLAFYFAYLMER